MDLQGKTIVMTGAGNGIGREVALEFARRGGRVVVSDRDGNAAQKVAGEIELAGGTAMPLACDVTKDEDMARLKEAADTFGPADVLMNHVGAASSGPLTEISLDDWRWVFEVNVVSIVRALKLFLPEMMRRRTGLVINTSSSLALFPELPIALPYIASKAGIVGLSEALALQCRYVGVRIMILAPDITETAFLSSERMVGIDPEEMAAAIPMSMKQPPKAVADALFRAIDQGRFLATNVPDYERLLRDRVTSLFEPDLRAYRQLEPVIAAAARAAAQARDVLTNRSASEEEVLRQMYV